MSIKDPMKEILSVSNLKVHFPIKKGLFSSTVGYVYAVDGISFTLREGKTIGLVGESGCGKTTAAFAILKLIQPSCGEVVFDGVDVTQARKSDLRSLRRGMQIIFQDPYSSLNPRMTVNQIIADPMKIYSLYQRKEEEERIAYLLEKVGLTYEQGKRYPHEFSGGQRQRIGIARALALTPKLIIGDEPVSALDVSIQAQIINLLGDLQKEFKLSYIIISHDLAVVEHLCDRVYVMYLGRIVEMASYRDLYLNPKHPYTQALLSAIPVPDPRKKRGKTVLKGDVPSPINPPSGCHFHPRCGFCLEGCNKEEPVLRDVGSEHYVACHLYRPDERR
jgi:oligopeptide/dipeptide ABC transporter ATP-binding protein